MKRELIYNVNLICRMMYVMGYVFEWVCYAYALLLLNICEVFS